MRKLIAATALAGLLTVTCAADTLVCASVCLAASSTAQPVSSGQKADASVPAAGDSGHLNRHHHNTGSWPANQNALAALYHQTGFHRVIAAPNCAAYDQVVSLRTSSNSRLVKGPVAIPLRSTPTPFESRFGAAQSPPPPFELSSHPRITQLRI